MLRDLRIKIGLMLALALAGLMVFAPTANASEEDGGSAPAARTEAQASEESSAAVAQGPVAPPCVYRFFEEHFWNFHLHGQNNCSYNINLKVVKAFGPDSACFGVARGASFTHSWVVGRYDRLEVC